MSRQSFNWSVLDRNMLYRMFLTLGKDIVGQCLSVSDLQNRLKTGIKTLLPVKVVTTRDITTKSGYVYIGGTYYSEYDQLGKRQVEIVFSYNPLDKFIIISRRRWPRMCKLLADTVLHEIIHMRQYRSRNFKYIPGYESSAERRKDRMAQEYYGHPNELGAYSFNIACELYEKFGTDSEAAKQYLDKSVNISKKSSYYRYLNVFDWDHNHIVIKSLKKKIIRNLPYAQNGKPFGNNNYLTY